MKQRMKRKGMTIKKKGFEAPFKSRSDAKPNLGLWYIGFTVSFLRVTVLFLRDSAVGKPKEFAEDVSNDEGLRVSSFQRGRAGCDVVGSILLPQQSKTEHLRLLP
jgi:hypothetical protein